MLNEIAKKIIWSIIVKIRICQLNLLNPLMILKEEVGKGIKFMSRDEKFLDPANWSEIRRGWIYEAAIPYTGERPLDFFIQDEDCPYRGTVVGKNGEFKSGKENLVILGLKQRKVVVISNDDICQDNFRYDLSVAPIYTIYDEDKEEAWYEDVVNGSHHFYAYLPKEVTGREAVVDLTNIVTISKNMLLNVKYDANAYIKDIETKMEYCLQLGAYKKTERVREEDVS